MKQGGELISWLALARKGNSPAQEKIILCYQKRVAGFIYSMIGRSEELEDLTQNVFVKMILRLGTLRCPEQFESWLFRLACNACMDFLRKEKLKRIFTRFLPEHKEISETEDSLSEEAEWLINALQKLPAGQRELIALVRDRDYSYEELAEITGSTLSSVKSRLFRAKQTLLERREHEFGSTSVGTAAARR